MKRCFVIGVLLCIAALSFHVPTWAEWLGPVRVGYIPIGDCLQLYVADELGYFRENGLKVHLRPIKGGPLIAMAVESGDLDVGWSNTVSLAVAHDKGFDFAILAPGAEQTTGPDHCTHSLLVARNSGLRSMGDLAGRTVAVNALANINDLAVKALLAEQGLDYSRVRLVEVPFPQMEAALASGSVQAALLTEPFITAALRKGTAEILVRTPHGVFGKRFLVATWFSRRAWIKAEPAKAEAFRKAVLRASDYIAANPESARDILARRAGIDPSLARGISLPLFPAESLEPELQGVIDQAYKYGLIKRPISPGSLLMNESH
ncbi:ABC transporter substrate-binding protein [Desulfocurvibacter africanus]|uniref:ABC transporter substrate-binding protein n=1 Tax=Desulfocurvibacter africanus TaxID=873 RepID=UPI0003FEB61D|nr:ABC transporter substrate-binding protein [Desulfocurvibacter africanus]